LRNYYQLNEIKYSDRCSFIDNHRLVSEIYQCDDIYNDNAIDTKLQLALRVPVSRIDVSTWISFSMSRTFEGGYFGKYLYMLVYLKYITRNII